MKDLHWWEWGLIGLSFLFTWNTRRVLRWLGKSVDEDGDGRQSWKKEVVPVLFSLVTSVVAIIEVCYDGEQISDVKFIFLVVSYLGASAVAAVLEVMNLKTALGVNYPPTA